MNGHMQCRNSTTQVRTQPIYSNAYKADKCTQLKCRDFNWKIHKRIFSSEWNCLSKFESVFEWDLIGRLIAGISAHAAKYIYTIISSAGHEPSCEEDEREKRKGRAETGKCIWKLKPRKTRWVFPLTPFFLCLRSLMDEGSIAVFPHHFSVAQRRYSYFFSSAIPLVLVLSSLTRLTFSEMELSDESITHWSSNTKHIHSRAVDDEWIKINLTLWFIYFGKTLMFMKLFVPN